MHSILFAALLALLAQATPAPAPAVKVGQPAPDFTLKYLAAGPDGKVQQQTLSLDELKRKGSVILAFFPAAFSPG